MCGCQSKRMHLDKTNNTITSWVCTFSCTSSPSARAHSAYQLCHNIPPEMRQRPRASSYKLGHPVIVKKTKVEVVEQALQLLLLLSRTSRLH